MLRLLRIVLNSAQRVTTEECACEREQVTVFRRYAAIICAIGGIYLVNLHVGAVL
jgi:hypothetical protein